MKIFFYIIYILFTIPVLSQTSKIYWSSFSSGFGTSTSINSSITSSIGSPFDGSASNGNSTIITGFLSNYDLIVTGTDEEKEEIPTVYKLDQNYPNPFNPTTKIGYAVPNVVDAKLASTTYIEIIIYDILGEEVRVLVNEFKSPGNYEVEFNASNLPSGIYFYKLNAGDFHQVKKMILLK